MASEVLKVATFRGDANSVQALLTASHLSIQTADTSDIDVVVSYLEQTL